MTARHIAGPWELSEGNTSVWAWSPWNAKVRIANIVKHSPMNGIDHHANAKLIASAPEQHQELLNCCSDFNELLQSVDLGEHSDVVVKALMRLDTVITKAKGE